MREPPTPKSYNKKQKLSLPPKSKFSNKNASSDKGKEASKLPNLDLSYYNLKDNAFIEKQPKFKFDKNSLIGQVVHKYSNSMTSAEIRLSLRRMDTDELLSSIVKDMDDLLNENEQLHKTIEALTQRNTEFEQTIADLRGEFASNSSEHSKTTESPRKLQTLMKEMNCKIVVNQSTPNIIEESNQQNGNSPMQCETSEEPAEHQIQEEVVVENTNESFNSLQEVSPIDTSNTSNASG
ncbi:hypothetical protein M3Y97_00656600 [Aphelenchoides bicaudatus]|nr:hypothetical protein M3Y97_00656600 [Aphelenchoides bicaudatus]